MRTKILSLILLAASAGAQMQRDPDHIPLQNIDVTETGQTYTKTFGSGLTLDFSNVAGFSLPATLALAIKDLDLGASGTAGSLDIFPTTASKGKSTYVADDAAANYTLTHRSGVQTASRTLSDPVLTTTGVYAVSTQAQTFTGTQTFGAIVTTGQTNTGTTACAAVTVSGDIAAPSANLPVLIKRATAGTGTDAVTLTIAHLFNGIYAQTPTGATTATTPTGTEISAGLSVLAVGDSFEFTLINLGTTGRNITFTAGASGVTIVGGAVIYPVADIGTGGASSGTFVFVNTASNTWIAYRR